MTQPSGGEEFCPGNTVPIRWTPSGDCTAVKIELMNGGSVARVISSSTGNNGTYDWVVPADLTGIANAQVRVSCLTPAACSDLSGSFSVWMNPQITQQPTDKATCPGQTQQFCVSATGGDLSYQWQQQQGSEWQDISGAVNSCYTTGIPGSYRCRVSNGCGELYSNSATLTLKTESTAPTGASASLSTLCVGESSTLTVQGGSLGTGAAWKWRAGSCNGTLVGSGASITVSPTVTTTYYVRAEGDCNTTSCASVTVNVKTLSTAAASASASPNKICIGQSATLTVHGGALGSEAAWKWYSGACGEMYIGDGASISVTPEATTTYYVRAEGYCNTTACVSATVTVTTPSTAPTGVTPSLAELCLGQSSSLAVEGGQLGNDAVWRWYTDSCDGTLVGEGPSISVSPEATTTYYVRAEGYCNVTACAAATVTVHALPGPLSELRASPEELCDHGATQLSATAEPGQTVKWYTGGCDGPLVGMGTSITVSLDSTTTYYARAWDPGTGCTGPDCYSATVTVHYSPTISQPPSGRTLCGGESVWLNVVAEGTPPLSYQWRRNGAGIAGATSMFYRIPAVTSGDAGQYDVVVTNLCGSLTSAPATLTIGSGPVITSEPQPQSVCASGAVTFSVGAEGFAPLHYQWRKDGQPIGGATQFSYTIPLVAPTDVGDYDVVVEDSCGSSTSRSVPLTTIAGPAIVTQPQSQAVCTGAAVTFTVTADGTPPLGYQWQKNGVDLPGETTRSLTIDHSGTEDAGTFRVIVTDSCGSVRSNPAVLEAGSLVITDQPLSQSAAAGVGVTLSVTAEGAGPLTYQWRKGGVAIRGATERNLSLVGAALDDVGEYEVEVRSPYCTATSAVASLTVTPAVPSLPTPADKATELPISLALDWSDTYGATSYEVYFGTDRTPSRLGTSTESAWPLDTLAYGTTYYWKIVATNEAGANEGPVWTFTTMPLIPAGEPDSPSPADGEVDVALDTSLYWSDVEDLVTYQVYLGTGSTLAKMALLGSTAASAWGPLSLDPDTRYYWCVAATNVAGSTRSAVWSFTTQSPTPAPATPSDPYPPDGAVDVAVDAELNWSAAEGATTYDVYLSTDVDVPDSVLLGATPDNRWIGASLQGGTTCYWRVVARNDAGETAGPEWSFTTAPWEAMTPQEEMRETPAGPVLCPAASAAALSLTLLGMRVARARELPGRRRAR